jgi:pimeloyl-ACP methyl ester carboxylesterase
MTQPRAAQSLLRAATHGQVVTLDAGHQLMTECPDGVLGALLDFLKPEA